MEEERERYDPDEWLRKIDDLEVPFPDEPFNTLNLRFINDRRDVLKMSREQAQYYALEMEKLYLQTRQFWKNSNIGND